MSASRIKVDPTPVLTANLFGRRSGPHLPLLGELNKATSFGPSQSPRLHRTVQSRTRSSSSQEQLPFSLQRCIPPQPAPPGRSHPTPSLLILRRRPPPPRSARGPTQPAWLASTGGGHSRRGFPGLITILTLFSRVSRSLLSGTTTPATPSPQPPPRDFSPCGLRARRLAMSSTNSFRPTLPH